MTPTRRRNVGADQPRGRVNGAAVHVSSATNGAGPARLWSAPAPARQWSQMTLSPAVDEPSQGRRGWAESAPARRSRCG